jgi:flavin reductase (DIM6/NTAB) family NADH-FMN oxidoreductase RutF
MSNAEFLPVLGRVPSGIFILTAGHDGQETGMLASWVMQAGFEPPMVTVAVKQGRYVGDWLAAHAPFVLNVVAEGQSALLRHFVRGFDPGSPAFEGLEIIRTEQGTPALSDCLGHLECVPINHVDSGDHRIFLAEVTGGSQRSDARPMVHVRKNGLSY